MLACYSLIIFFKISANEEKMLPHIAPISFRNFVFIEKGNEDIPIGNSKYILVEFESTFALLSCFNIVSFIH